MGATPVITKNVFARHKVLTAVGALVAVTVIGAAIGGSEADNDKSLGASKGSPSSSLPAPPSSKSAQQLAAESRSVAAKASASAAAAKTAAAKSAAASAAASKAAASKAAAAAAAKAAAERPVAISAREFGKLVKDPDAYSGRHFIVYGEVTQFDAATGTEDFLANSGATKKYPEYGFVDFVDNSAFGGDSAVLSDVVEGDLFQANVEVVGSFSYDTQIGGNTTVPQFRIQSIQVYGSTNE